VRQYGVMSIPTMIIFKDGQEVDRLVGVMPKEMIAERLDQWIS
ncbi:MAG: thiol reductase thioredoxin, partial [Firmicutes bacterium]|jgi:thioredoxin 1|nr:thiol reductase thioredoxin [Bacillota bacterium]